jgi:hypothetical protein
LVLLCSSALGVFSPIYYVYFGWATLWLIFISLRPCVLLEKFISWLFNRSDLFLQVLSKELEAPHTSEYKRTGSNVQMQSYVLVNYPPSLTFLAFVVFCFEVLVGYIKSPVLEAYSPTLPQVLLLASMVQVLDGRAN